MKKLFAFIVLMLDGGDTVIRSTRCRRCSAKLYSVRPRSAARSTSSRSPIRWPRARSSSTSSRPRFSVGCSIEAHEFAEAITKFEALGATVIGVSSDDIDTLGKFSVQACQGKFPVASDNTQNVMKSYDAVMAAAPRLRQPRLVRDRAERQGDLQLPEPEPEPPRREDAGRAQGVVAEQEVARAAGARASRGRAGVSGRRR